LRFEVVSAPPEKQSILLCGKAALRLLPLSWVFSLLCLFRSFPEQ
jgi:hypothetical protein